MADDFFLRRNAWIREVGLCRRLTPAAVRLACLLFQRFNPNHYEQGYPSISRLAAEMGATRTTVLAAVECLCAEGLLIRESRVGRLGNAYRTPRDLEVTPEIEVQAARSDQASGGDRTANLKRKQSSREGQIVQPAGRE